MLSIIAWVSGFPVPVKCTIFGSNKVDDEEGGGLILLAALRCDRVGRLDDIAFFWFRWMQRVKRVDNLGKKNSAN